MLISVREQCIQMLADQLALFTVANSYPNNAGSSLYRCRQSVPATQTPALVLWDGAEVATAHFGVVDVEMDAWAVMHVRTVDRTDAGALLAELYRCLMDLRVESPITRLAYRQGMPRYPDDGSNILQIESKWSLSYRYLRGDPYTAP